MAYGAVVKLGFCKHQVSNKGQKAASLGYCCDSCLLHHSCERLLAPPNVRTLLPGACACVWQDMKELAHGFQGDAGTTTKILGRRQTLEEVEA